VVTRIDKEPDAAKRRRRQWAQNLKDALASRPGGEWSPKRFHREVETALEGSGQTITIQAVYFWLSGETAPRPEMQNVIAQVLGIPAHLLFPVGQ